jgi:hypothetical protein
MLLSTGLEFVLHEKPKYLGAVLGTAVSLFLVLLLSGFYFGFRRDITIVQDSFDVDLWVASREILGFDFAGNCDDLVLAKVLGHSSVQAASRVVVDFSKWRIPDTGAMENIQVVGFEPDSGIQTDWGIRHPNLATLLHADGQVLVDLKDRPYLGIEHLGQWGAEFGGRSARPAGWMKDHRLFNVSCLIVTDLHNARSYLRLPNNAVHYLAVKCHPDADVRRVAADLRASLPENSVHTAREFHDLTQAYWQGRTGIAPMLFLSMTLAGVVGFMTVFLTFYLLTSQKLPVYAAMKALGASMPEIGVLLAVQLAVVFVAAAAVAGVVLLGALAAFARTPISVVLPGWVVALDVGMMALASALACGPSLWKVARAEPAEAFRT